MLPTAKGVSHSAPPAPEAAWTSANTPRAAGIRS